MIAELKVGGQFSGAQRRVGNPGRADTALQKHSFADPPAKDRDGRGLGQRPCLSWVVWAGVGPLCNADFVAQHHAAAQPSTGPGGRAFPMNTDALLLKAGAPVQAPTLGVILTVFFVLGV